MASGSLGHLAATVSLDIDPFKSSARALNAQIKATGSALRAQKFAIKGYGSSLNGMKAAYGSMGQQMKNYEAKLARQKKTYQDLKGKTASTAEEQAKLTTRQANAANQYNRTSAQAERLKAQMERMNREITLQDSGWYRASQRMNKVGSGMQTVGRKAQTVGSTLTHGITMPIAGIGVAAVKTALDFDHQMNRVKAISSSTSGEFKAMKAEAIDLGAKTQFSAREAAAGMENLASAGMKPHELMKAMPGVLDLAAVSGGNVAASADAAASALNAFGLSADKSGHLANVYAKAAADTNAETQDMAEAMKYAAPVSHSLGASLEDTAAAIGIMSNAGIKGTQAGTTLRGALTRLAKPTKAMQGVMDKLGISFFDSQGKMKPMGTIIGDLGTSMKGYDKKTQAAMLTTLFGKEALSGMMALVQAGPDKFNKLSSGLEHSDGAARKMAKTMNDDAKASVENMTGSLETAGIKIGEALAPSIIDITKDVSKLVNSFTKLNPKTQEMIVKFGLTAAAAGPLISIFGKLSGGIGGTIKSIASVVGGINRMRAAAKLGGTGLQILKSGFSRAAYSATTFAGQAAATTGALGGIEGASGAAAGGLGLLNPAVLGVTAAVVGGIAVWELWGKKAVASAERTGRWGSDVGKTADTALTKFKGTSDGINDALDNLDGSFSTSTSSMSKKFDQEFSDIEKSAHDHMQNVKKSVKGLSSEVAATVEKEAQKTKRTLDKINDDAKKHNAEAQQILKNHNGKIADLNDNERQLLKNDQYAMQQDEIKALGITGQKKKKIMASLNKDYSKMSQAQRDSQIRDLDDISRTTTKSMAKQQRALKKALDSSRISQKEYDAGMDALHKHTASVMDKTAAEYIKLEKASGKSTATIKQDMLRQGLSYKNGMAYIKQYRHSVETNADTIVDTTGKMSEKARKAADTWNKLVFDPKTGEVKSNAQEEVNKAVKSGKKWDQIKLLAKEGKLKSNAKEMVANAAISQGKWNGMTWKEQKALIHSEGGKDLVKMMEDSGEWNDLTIQQKTAIVNAKGQKEIADLLIKTGEWNELTPAEQSAVLKTSGTSELYDMLNKIGKWNQLTPKEQIAVLSGDDKGIGNLLVKLGLWNGYTLKQQIAQVATKGGGEMATALNKIGVWNGLTPKEQVAIMTAKGKTEMVDALVTAGVWNGLKLKKQQALVTSKGTADLITQMNKMGQWNDLPSDAKDAIVHAKGSADLANIITKYDLWKQIPASTVKQMVAQDKASGNAQAALDAINHYNKANPGKKQLIAYDNASGPLNKATDSTNVFRKTSPGGTKNAKGKDSTSGSMNLAKSSVDRFRKTSPGGLKNARGKDQASGQMNKAKGSTDRFRNTSTGSTKQAKGSDLASRPMGSAKGSVDRWRGTSAGGTKHARAADNASWAAGRAFGAVMRFAGLHNYKRTLTTIHKTINWVISKFTKKAKGDDHFAGGTAMVNDQTGSQYRELITLPNGQAFIPEGRNVLYNLPRGTRITKASQTAKLFKRYAAGTVAGNEAVDTILSARPAIQHMNEATQVRMGNSNVQINNNNADVIDALHEQMDVQKQQLSLLSRMLDIATDPMTSQTSRENVRNMSQQFNSFDNQRVRGAL